MTVYILAQLSFTDRPRYDAYMAQFMEVFDQFNGRVLAADEAPAVLEGEWPHQKAVLLQFPDEASMREWATSPAYQEISKDRVAGSRGPVLLLHGFT